MKLISMAHTQHCVKAGTKVSSNLIHQGLSNVGGRQIARGGESLGVTRYINACIIAGNGRLGTRDLADKE